MPFLDLPTGDSNLTGGDVPVRADGDVLAEFPTVHKRPESAPVRDAFVSAWVEGFKEYQNIAARAAAQCDPLQATGDYLKSYAEEHSVFPKVGESEQSIRDRMFTPPRIVTPEAIVAEVNELLEPYTDGTARLHELELDGWFVHNSDPSVWDSYVGAPPDYPDRYYDELSDLEPPGAIPSSGLSRNFHLRIPPLESNDSTISYVLDFDDSGIFITDGTGADDDDVGFFVFVDPQRSQDLYTSIVGLVETIKGHGMSWTLDVDPSLAA